MISSNNPSIYFDKAYAYIQYNKAVFGPSINSNGKMTVIRGANFTNTNIYNCFVYDLDYSGNSDKIWISFYYFNQNRVTLSSTPVPLLHFKIELLSTSSDWTQANLIFNDPTYTAKDCYYALTSNTTTKYLYDQVIYIPSNTPPTVYNMYPFQINAGIDEVLTIQGNNFGTTEGKVLFTSANNGGQSYLNGLDAQYIDDWKNTQIKVKVPSRVKDGYSADTHGVAGDGPVKIITAEGNSCTSPNIYDIYIPYAIINNEKAAGETIRRQYIVRRHCDYDFMFTLHSAYNSFIHYDKIYVIEAALSHWSSLTGLTLILEKNSNGQYVFESSVNNNKNMILPMNYLTPPPSPDVVMTTRNAVRYSTINGVTYLYRSYNESHIYIKEESATVKWSYNLAGSVPNTYLSFFEAFMHELGHILMLDHVNDPYDLMYFTTQSGPYPNIKIINSNSVPVLGVKNNITASKSIPWPTSGYVPPFYPPGALKATLTTTKACYGANNGSITANVTGGTPNYNYEWKNSSGNVVGGNGNKLSNQPAGTYTLKLTDARGCVQNYTETISLAGGLPLFLGFTKIPANGSIPELLQANVSGGLPPYSYKWSIVRELATELQRSQTRGGKGNTDCILNPNYQDTYQMPTFLPSTGCKLSVTVTDANGCKISGTQPASKDELYDNFIHDENNEIAIYPNPTTGELRITSYELRVNNIELFDVYGRKLSFHHLINSSIFPTYQLEFTFLELKLRKG